ncbi:hypothetical protein NBRC116584_03590 [Hydrogenophaga sp. 5NK40-0174]
MGVACAALMVVAGCQKHGASSEWFPLQDGDEQTYGALYEGDEPTAFETWHMEVHGPVTYGDDKVMVRHHSAGANYYIKTDEEGIRRVALRTDIDREPTPDNEPRWVLKAPYTVGTEWTTPTVPYLIRRRNEHPRELKYTHQVLMNWRIDAVDEEVRTEAGTFKPCLRVEGVAKVNIYVDPVQGFTDVPLLATEWYCKGKGLVKLIRKETVPQGFFTGGVLTAELIDP